MDFFRKSTRALAEDHTLQSAQRHGSRAVRALPRATGNYLVEKVPIVHWLPRYNPRWVLNDLLAGVTVGALLIPQALAYAKLATIPPVYGLMSAWLPNFLYMIMGTSKDMSTGPTSLMGLLTAEIIRDIATEGGFNAQTISAAVAMSVGIYCLAIGMLKLGFLLEFVSIPVLHGFISAAGIVIMLGQIPSLFGITARTGTAKIIHDIFAKIPQYQGPTVGVGLGGIALLIILEKSAAKWGSKNKIIWVVGLARSAIVLVLFTGISYGVNKDRKKNPVWELSKVQADGIHPPVMPPGTLISKVFPRAVAPFLAATIEHLAIAKAFARRNNYVIDPAQELVYLGVTNFFNSFFSSMPVGGAMSRTAVNSATGVKSPVYGLFSGGFVLLSIFVLSPALYWIPKATLAAIIVMAVISILSPPSTFLHYWKTSLIDFVASMLAFWVTLFVNTETGIGAAVGFQLVCHILYTTFTRVRRMTALPAPPRSLLPTDGKSSNIPVDVQVFKPSHSIIFFNAMSIKDQCFDMVQTFHQGAATTLAHQNANRNWSTAGERRARALRRRAGVADDELNPIKVVVVDMSMVAGIDDTGLVALRDLKADLEGFAGRDVEVRFAGVQGAVRMRMRRGELAVWDVDDANVKGIARQDRVGCPVYGDVWEAVSDRWRKSGEENDMLVVGNEKGDGKV